MEQTLKLNKQTNLYEASILIQVEPEIFRRLLSKYLEDYNIDPANIEDYIEALYNVSKVSRWLEHKRVTIVIPEQEPIKLQEPERHAVNMRSLTKQEVEELRNKALVIPVDQWEFLKTPLVPWTKKGENIKERNRAYQKRFDEKLVLDALKKELETAKLEKLEVVANSVNNARMR